MASLSDLPLDVWQLIAWRVDPKDMWRLMRTCRSLYRLLQVDEFWDPIVRRQWLDTLTQYGIDVNIPTFEHEYKYYALACTFFHKSALVKDELVNHSIGLEQALDIFCNEDYIPALSNFLQLYGQKTVAEQTLAYIPLMGKAETVLQYLSYTIALDWIPRQDLGIPEDARMHERVWFRISMFDKSFHHLVRKRFLMLKNWHLRLYQVFYTDTVFNGTDAVFLEDGPQKILNFDSLATFHQVLTKVIEAALEEMSSVYSLPVPLNNKTYYEHFSLARFYSGASPGTEVLWKVVLVRLLCDLFQDHMVRIGVSEPHKLHIKYTEIFISIAPDFYAYVHRQAPDIPLPTVHCGSLRQMQGSRIPGFNKSSLTALKLLDHIETFLLLDTVTHDCSMVQDVQDALPALASFPNDVFHGKITSADYHSAATALRSIMKFSPATGLPAGFLNALARCSVSVGSSKIPMSHNTYDAPGEIPLGSLVLHGKYGGIGVVIGADANGHFYYVYTDCHDVNVLRYTSIVPVTEPNAIAEFIKVANIAELGTIYPYVFH